MKTSSLLFIALVMPFGCFIVAGVLGKRIFSAYRRRQTVLAS